MDREKAPDEFKRLIDIVARLRSKDGCPWDRRQTPKTIAPYLLEETHEVLDAIESGDQADLAEELGDLLLEVSLLAQMAEEAGDFNIADSLQLICDKLVRRHPHVFAGAEAGDDAALKKKWSDIKAAEKPDRGLLDGVPRSLPALHRAGRISEKAAEAGFDWPDAVSVIDKLEEEFAELKEAVDSGRTDRMEEELGDLLFALVNLGRHLGVHAERGLHGTTDRFMRRFSHVERELKRLPEGAPAPTIDLLEEWWQVAKRVERESGNESGD